jgi:S1-C subfamily serine protease
MKKQLLFVFAIALLVVGLGLSRAERDLSTVIEDSLQSVVQVIDSEFPEVPASGFYIGDGIIVTAGHVSKRDTISHVVFMDGTEYEVIEHIVHPDFDCGFLLIETVDRPALKFDTLPLHRGDTVFMLGHPHVGSAYDGFSILFNTSKGIVTGFLRLETFGDMEMFISDAVGHPGNSGSVLIDLEGEIRGLHVGGGRSRCGAPLHGFEMNVKVSDILKAMESAGLRR